MNASFTSLKNILMNSPAIASTILPSTKQEILVDLDGDGYPDFVGKGGIQYSMPWGGIGKLKTVKNFTPFSSTNNAVGIAFSACPVKQEKSVGNGIRDGKFHLSASMGASLGTGETHTKIQFADVNGDGLPDKINVDSSNVRYNLGYSFSAPYSFSGEVSEGSNVNGGFNANISSALEGILTFKDSKAFSVGQVSISGGIGKSTSTNVTNEQIFDINGDGLPDKVRLSGSNTIEVSYNCGSQNFSQWKTLSNIWAISKDETESVTSTLGVTGGVTILSSVKLNFGVQATPFGLSDSHGQAMLIDMNGDGVYKGSQKEIEAALANDKELTRGAVSIGELVANDIVIMEYDQYKAHKGNVEATPHIENGTLQPDKTYVYYTSLANNYIGILPWNKWKALG